MLVNFEGMMEADIKVEFRWVHEKPCSIDIEWVHDHVLSRYYCVSNFPDKRVWHASDHMKGMIPCRRCRLGNTSGSTTIARGIGNSTLLPPPPSAIRALLIANIASAFAVASGSFCVSRRVRHRHPPIRVDDFATAFLHRHQGQRQGPTAIVFRPISIIVAPSSFSSTKEDDVDHGIDDMSKFDMAQSHHSTEDGRATTKISRRDDDESLLLRRRKQNLRRHVRSLLASAYPRPPTPDDADDGNINNGIVVGQRPSYSSSSSSLRLSHQSDLVFDRLFALTQYEDASSIGIFLSMPHGEIRTDDAIRRMIVDDGSSSSSSSSSAAGGGRGRGKVLYVPRVGLDFDNSDMDMIRCDSGTTSSPCDAVGEEMTTASAFYDGWPRNRWGIPEPPHAFAASDVASPGDIDLLIVPGLAFDVDGRRLGQGKGYYDRFIARMRGEDDNSDRRSSERTTTGGGGKIPLLVGVCLEEQFLHEVPHGVDLGHRTSDDGDDDGDHRRRGGDIGIIPVSDHDYPMDIVLTPTRTLILRNVPSPISM